MKPEKNDKKAYLLFTPDELDFLQDNTWQMAKSFGLDRRIGNLAGKRAVGFYALDLECLHDVAELAKNAGWKLSDATHLESAHFEIKDGSLILTNKQRNTGMVEINMPFNGELDQDA